MAIECQSVHKTYTSGYIHRRRTHALQGVSLSVKKGEVFGLLGPNGAGKTTLLNIFSCQLLPDSGSVAVLGQDITQRTPQELKLRLNMCSGNPNFPWSLTVYEILKFYSLLYGVCAECNDRVAQVIEIFGLAGFRDRRYDQLSTGTKQRLALAKSLVNNPELLFLDEPTIGLDPDIARKIREQIVRVHRENKITVILTTHYMKEAEELCERIAFIKNGQIRALGTSSEIVHATRGENLEEAFIELAE
jgi:ABC-2 type transport system ATP-binding protein